MSDRRVHFSSPIHQVRYLDKKWETASRLARDGSDWLRMSLDRQRFRDRIERTAEILNRVLEFNFRQQIYHERFENFVISKQQATTTIAAATTEQSIESTSAPQQQSSSVTQNQSQNNNNYNKKRRSRKGNKNRRKNRGRHNRKK